VVLASVVVIWKLLLGELGDKRVNLKVDPPFTVVKIDSADPPFFRAAVKSVDSPVDATPFSNTVIVQVIKELTRTMELVPTHESMESKEGTPYTVKTAGLFEIWPLLDVNVASTWKLEVADMGLMTNEVYEAPLDTCEKGLTETLSGAVNEKSISLLVVAPAKVREVIVHNI